MPAPLIADSCIFNSTETYTINNNKLNVESPSEFTVDTTRTINMTLAFANEVNFEISNLSLNNSLLYNPTDRIGDFRITSYNLNGTDYPVPAHESQITGIVTPPTDLTQEVINNFTFIVEWYDKENNIYNNFKDVEVTKKGLPATIPITLSVTQKLQTP